MASPDGYGLFGSQDKLSARRDLIHWLDQILAAPSIAWYIRSLLELEERFPERTCQPKQTSLNKPGTTTGIMFPIGSGTAFTTQYVVRNFSEIEVAQYELHLVQRALIDLFDICLALGSDYFFSNDNLKTILPRIRALRKSARIQEAIQDCNAVLPMHKNFTTGEREELLNIRKSTSQRFSLKHFQLRRALLLFKLFNPALTGTSGIQTKDLYAFLETRAEFLPLPSLDAFQKLLSQTWSSDHVSKLVHVPSLGDLDDLFKRADVGPLDKMAKGLYASLESKERHLNAELRKFFEQS